MRDFSLGAAVVGAFMAGAVMVGGSMVGTHMMGALMVRALMMGALVVGALAFKRPASGAFHLMPFFVAVGSDSRGMLIGNDRPSLLSLPPFAMLLCPRDL